MNTLRNKTDKAHTTYGSRTLALAVIAGALLMTPAATQAQVKGSALPVAETLTLADRVMMVTDPSGTPSTKTATLTLLKATMGSGSGDVVGPASAVNNRVVFFDGTTGKLIKDSGITLSGTNTGDQDLSDYLTSSTAATSYQPLDSDLTAIAALTTTSTGRSLLAAADAAAIRTIAGITSGDVVGPASAVNNRVVFFDGTTGKLIKDSGLTLSGTNTGDQDLSGYLTSSTAATTYQPLDSDLTAIAALTTTTTGRSLLAAADAAAIRTIAGITFGGTRQILHSDLSGLPTSSSLSAILDFTGSTRGSVLYRGGLTWSALTPGTSGQVLTSGGAGADPSWTTVGVSDGDKGSITVSSSGTVWTIDASAVTDSMLAGSISPSKVTGTAAILGANTFTEKQSINVASGPPLEIQIAGVKKFEFSSNGGLLIADSSTWLPYGVDGNFYFGGRGIFRQNSGGVNSITIDASDSTPENQSIGFYIGASIVSGVYCGAGSPEGVRAAPPGSLYLNRSGGAGATLYVKESGSGNTGWIAK